MGTTNEAIKGNVRTALYIIVGLVVFLVFVLVPANKFGFLTAAAYFGTLAGATVGFVALIAGHTYNSHLNRLRDRELRIIRADACAVAILYELSVNTGTFRTVVEYLSEPGDKIHLHVAQYAEQFSSEIFKTNIIEFCAGIVEVGSTTDIRPINSFYSNVKLVGGVMREAEKMAGMDPISAGEKDEMIEKFSGVEAQGNQAMAEVRRLRALLSKEL